MPHNHNGQKWIRNEKRCALYARDGFKCVYCLARRRLCLDHVDPSGGNGVENLVSSCWDCNGDKGSRHLEEWLEERAARGESRASLAEVRQRVALMTFLPIDLAWGKSLEKHRPRKSFDLIDTHRMLRRVKRSKSTRVTRASLQA